MDRERLDVVLLIAESMVPEFDDRRADIEKSIEFVEDKVTFLKAIRDAARANPKVRVERLIDDALAVMKDESEVVAHTTNTELQM